MSNIAIDELIELFKTRRSIRAFKPDPVPDEYINKIIEAARWAPSGANAQPWEFIVIKNKEIKDEIVKLFSRVREFNCAFEETRIPELRLPMLTRPLPEPGFPKAPVFIICCGDPRTNLAHPIWIDHEETMISGLATAFIYMHLAAKVLGLASQWVSAVSSPVIDYSIRKLLGIPEGIIIYDMMVLGYPGYEIGPRSPRNLEEFTHHEKYDMKKYRSDDEIIKFVKGMREQARRAMKK